MSGSSSGEVYSSSFGCRNFSVDLPLYKARMSQARKPEDTRTPQKANTPEEALTPEDEEALTSLHHAACHLFPTSCELSLPVFHHPQVAKKAVILVPQPHLSPQAPLSGRRPRPPAARKRPFLKSQRRKRKQIFPHLVCRSRSRTPAPVLPPPKTTTTNQCWCRIGHLRRRRLRTLR